MGLHRRVGDRLEERGRRGDALVVGLRLGVRGEQGIGLVRSHEEQAGRGPPGCLARRAVEEPGREIGEQAAVDDQVLVSGPRVLLAHGIEDDRDRHAHPDRRRHLELLGRDAEVRLGVTGQHEHPSLGHV
jgi:hypothetical protein